MTKRPTRARRATRDLYPFLCYGTPLHGADRYYRPSEARDLLPLLFLQQALQAHGYALRDAIVNMPPQNGENPGHVAQVGLRLGSSSAVLLGTRIPRDDDPSDRKRILRGYTEYEPYVLEAGSRVFAHLSRKKMLLREELWPLVRPGFESRRNIIYTQLRAANFKELRTAAQGRKQPLPREPRTSAFLLNTRLWENGPTLIAAFAMDGVASIVWSQMLARRHADWLLEPGFTMVDLVRGAVPTRPTLLDFASQWKMEIVLRARL
jgi:hypothetical protein